MANKRHDIYKAKPMTEGYLRYRKTDYSYVCEGDDYNTDF